MAEVVVQGEVDVSNAAALTERIIVAAVGESRVVVDLARCTFLDSSGLNALVRARERAEAEIVLRGATGLVRQVLEISGLDQLFDLVD
jgi:anti-sigma B factor antagonist